MKISKNRPKQGAGSRVKHGCEIYHQIQELVKCEVILKRKSQQIPTLLRWWLRLLQLQSHEWEFNKQFDIWLVNEYRCSPLISSSWLKSRMFLSNNLFIWCRSMHFYLSTETERKPYLKRIIQPPCTRSGKVWLSHSDSTITISAKPNSGFE